MGDAAACTPDFGKRRGRWGMRKGRPRLIGSGTGAAFVASSMFRKVLETTRFTEKPDHRSNSLEKAREQTKKGNAYGRSSTKVQTSNPEKSVQC